MHTTGPDLDRKLRLIDQLDLEPIAFKLVNPEPGETGVTIEEADRLVLKYRRFLKLCAMQPEQDIVPTKEIDPVWHTHILDTAKYEVDCQTIFGFMLHHFPYLGSRGPADVELLKQKGQETRELYMLHFGEPMYEGPDMDASMDASMCSASGCAGGCGNGGCNRSSTATMERPRLVRE